jgi:hypothetical protein
MKDMIKLRTDCRHARKHHEYQIKSCLMESSEINKTALPPCHDNFQVIGVPLFDNEMIALAGKNEQIFQNK